MEVVRKCHRTFFVLLLSLYALSALAVGKPMHVSSIPYGETSSTFLSFDKPIAVAVAGNYAYVISQYAGLKIIDVSNPAAPRHVGAFSAGTMMGGVPVTTPPIDFSNPVVPGNQFPLPNMSNEIKQFFPTSIAIAGHYAYVTSSFMGIVGSVQIIDISNPSNPVRVGSITDGEGGARLDGANSVAIAGTYAFVTAEYSDALEVIDISNPSTPQHAASLSNRVGGAQLDSPKFVTISGNYAYVLVAGGYRGPEVLEIIDISSPKNPTHVGYTADISGMPKFVAISGNYAYIIGDILEIIDISNPSNPTHVSGVYNRNDGSYWHGDLYSFAIVGPYAIIADHGSDALEIVNISDPHNPTHADVIFDGEGGAFLDGPNFIAAAGRYAYVTTFSSGTLEIFDVSAYAQQTVPVIDATPCHSPAVFSATTGNVHIPIVEIPDDVGGTARYEANMVLIPNSAPLAFSVTEIVPATACTSHGEMHATFSPANGTVHIPVVEVPDHLGGIVKYQVDLVLIPDSVPPALSVTEVIPVQ